MSERPMEHFSVDGVNFFEITDAKARQDCSDLKEDFAQLAEDYQPYYTLTKSSSAFTIEDGYYATTGDKAALSGYRLCSLTAQTNFNFYFDAATISAGSIIFASIYNTSIATGNNVACYRSNTSTLPSENSKAQISAGQILAVSVYTPSLDQNDFTLYANYIPLLKLSNSVYLNTTQLEQIGNNASSLARNYVYGKKIAWFGDSISALRTLPHTVGTLTGATVYDCSIKGSCIGRTYSNMNSFSFCQLVTAIIAGDFSTQRTQLAQYAADTGQDVSDMEENLNTLASIDFSEVDYVVLLQGTNDFGIPINVLSGSEYSTRLEEMQALMDDAISRFLTYAPNLQFYIFSPFYRGDKTVDNYDDTLPEYVSAENAVAQKYSIPFCNLYTDSRICSTTAGYYLNPDTVHPSEAGDLYLAEICAKYLATH